ncbi:MAG: STAS domain-containing protein [Pyrinomonadaceae bacterium]|nr:STAS domain-containing protein [Pyrinomonadaceae bacterium]
MNKIELVERETPEAVVIEIAGQLTIGGNNETLIEKVRAHLAAGRRLLVINLEQCQRVDSSGFGDLVTCVVTAARHDAHVRLTNVSPQIRSLIKMAHLHQAFDIFDSEEEALKAPPPAA